MFSGTHQELRRSRKYHVILLFIPKPNLNKDHRDEFGHHMQLPDVYASIPKTQSNCCSITQVATQLEIQITEYHTLGLVGELWKFEQFRPYACYQ